VPERTAEVNPIDATRGTSVGDSNQGTERSTASSYASRTPVTASGTSSSRTSFQPRMLMRLKEKTDQFALASSASARVAAHSHARDSIRVVTGVPSQLT
jgi:hypothetical protein